MNACRQTDIKLHKLVDEDRLELQREGEGRWVCLMVDLELVPELFLLGIHCLQDGHSLLVVPLA